MHDHQGPRGQIKRPDEMQTIKATLTEEAAMNFPISVIHMLGLVIFLEQASGQAPLLDGRHHCAVGWRLETTL